MVKYAPDRNPSTRLLIPESVIQRAVADGRPAAAHLRGAGTVAEMTAILQGIPETVLVQPPPTITYHPPAPVPTAPLWRAVGRLARSVAGGEVVTITHGVHGQFAGGGWAFHFDVQLSTNPGITHHVYVNGLNAPYLFIDVT